MCQPVCSHVSILTTGTTALVINAASLAQARLCTPNRIQHVPDPPPLKFRGLSLQPTYPDHSPCCHPSKPSVTGKVLNAEKADMEGMWDPTSTMGSTPPIPSSSKCMSART